MKRKPFSDLAEQAEYNEQLKKARVAKKQEKSVEGKPQKILSQEEIPVPKKLSNDDLANLEKPRQLPSLPKTAKAGNVKQAMDLYLKENSHLKRNQVLEVFKNVEFRR